MPDTVIITARRDSVTRTRTIDVTHAEAEAERLRSEGWTVKVGQARSIREAERTRKQRAAVIAAHRNGRAARQLADDAAKAADRERPSTA
jgi:hypothetical protein